MIHAADYDAQLVRRCRANDAAAFNEIVVRYRHRVCGFVSRMIGPGPDAEDLAQDTFVRAFGSIHSFESRAALNTWLFRIATNLCIDYRRRRSRRVQESPFQFDADGEPEPGFDFPDERYEPGQILMNSELGDELTHAIGRLPDRMRAVFLLFDVEGLSYDAIAGVLACPLGTVKSRLFHARMLLREAMEPYLTGNTRQPRNPGAAR